MLKLTQIVHHEESIQVIEHRIFLRHKLDNLDYQEVEPLSIHENANAKKLEWNRTNQ